MVPYMPKQWQISSGGVSTAQYSLCAQVWTSDSVLPKNTCYKVNTCYPKFMASASSFILNGHSSFSKPPLFPLLVPFKCDLSHFLLHKVHPVLHITTAHLKSILTSSRLSSQGRRPLLRPNNQFVYRHRHQSFSFLDFSLAFPF